MTSRATTTRKLSELAQRTAALRRELRAAVRAGDLVLPEGARLSVTCERGSLYSAMDIEIVGAPAGWAFGADRRKTPAAVALGAELEVHLRRHLDGVWGEVRVDGAGLASVARRGFVPGED